MGIFDLVLILSVLTSFVTLVTVAVIAATGRVQLAWRILRAWLLCAAAYLGVVVIASMFTRPRVLAVGEDACFDDWCVAVERVDKARTPAAQTYAVTFRLSSRARRISQRERNFVPYLRDGAGRRYDAGPVSTGESFDVLLGPGESVHTTRVFELPAESAEPQLKLAHEGGFPIGWFIIGQGPFAKGIWVPIR